MTKTQKHTNGTDLSKGTYFGNALEISLGQASFLVILYY